MADEVLRGRCDSFVVKTDVHFPTDISLLFDAMRKVVELIAKWCERFGMSDWGGLPELNQPQHGAYCSEQDQALLNENYFVFGYYLLDEQAKDYFYFDRHGDIGVLEFNRDDTSDLAEIWQALCEESLADMGLAEMLQVQIDCISLTMDM